MPSFSQTGIVGFLDNKGGIIGTGFVASKDGLIVTCSHVIEAISKSIKNDLSVSIKFAKIEKIYQAIVLKDFLFDSKKEDIVFLKLHEDLPCEVEPLKLGPSQGSENHNVISFGYPKLEDVEGLPAEGHVIGVSRYQGENVIAIESGNITKGYSGAPVFDEIYGWVIGLIVSIIPEDRMGRLEKTALAIPSETLKRINPNVECNELIDEIINVCRKQSEIEIMALGAKYISSLFVPRKGLDEILKEFLDNIDRTKKENEAIRVRNAKIPGENEKIKKYNQSVEEYNKDLSKDGKKKKKKKELKEMAEKPILNCLLFKGEAGIGKTNHLCHLCEKFGNEYPILFLSGGRMFLTGANSIEDEFRRSLDLIDDYYGMKLTEIEEISNLSGRYLILIIDAINECTNINKIKINLSQIISYWKERNIAFVISCRDIDWRFFDDETSLIDSIFFKEEVNYLSRSGTFMKEFSDEEFDMAWKKYKKYYKLKGNISKEIIDICKQPIMLRFFAEAYSKEKVPKMDIRRIQIFNKYWDKKLSEKKMEREGRDFLFNLVEIMIQLRKVELGEKILIRNTHINPDSPDTIFSKILSENIIIFKDYDKIMHENKIGFTYEAFFEFVIARRFLSDYTEICEKELLEKFKVMIDDIPSFKNYMGAIEYIILLLEENEEKIYIKLTNMISEIREYNDIAIRIISKLRSPLSVQTALKMLANDYELDINNQVYNIFINNYKYFSNSYNKDMFYIFSSETNPKFRRKPIKFLLDNYNALPDELKQLIIHLSENKNEITRIELAKAITNYAPSEDTSQAGLPSDIFGKLLSNLFINADRLLLAEVMDLLSETYASLEKNTRDLILLEMMKNSLIEYSQLDKIIISNINIISTKAIREILIRFIVDQDPLIRLKAIFYLKRIIDNINYKYDGILSRDEIYEFAKILKRDNDIEINRIAGEQFSRIN